MGARTGSGAPRARSAPRRRGAAGTTLDAGRLYVWDRGYGGRVAAERRLLPLKSPQIAGGGGIWAIPKDRAILRLLARTAAYGGGPALSVQNLDGEPQRLGMPAVIGGPPLGGEVALFCE